MDARRDVRVGVHSVGYTGVDQYLMDDLGVLALLEHEGGEGVPKIVGAGFLEQVSRAHVRREVAPNQVISAHRATSP